ncbi:hypothetical protein HRJ45_23710 [Vibrio coralliilyticus]|uniref:hypothetical protein n=1 Tax=Vibrio coralliilyticus TaxID=190893 RepID=UPI00155F7C0F|nr:hypothetical protein [Vibrio coralliilyticus]NRF27988.1 hypothetical protein [Vibrio coralliilyticus]NRF82121.1 hypothetical protein [Vibrio coralliilyticus]
MGECLKVVDDDSNTWYTSSPSESFARSLGYTLEDTPLNEGRTYAGTSPNGFVYFTQDGLGVESPAADHSNWDSPMLGVGGQADRWCKTLGEINFAGRSNWHLPTDKAALRDNFHLGALNGEGAYAYGWPNYYSATLHPGIDEGELGLPDLGGYFVFQPRWNSALDPHQQWPVWAVQHVDVHGDVTRPKLHAVCMAEDTDS